MQEFLAADSSEEHTFQHPFTAGKVLKQNVPSPHDFQQQHGRMMEYLTGINSRTGLCSGAEYLHFAVEVC